MAGWVKLTKQFTNDELWFNVTAFRLYVWILMKAAYDDGIVLNGMKLTKGQYLRAYSQLGEDLMYIEGRAKKPLAKSTVKRAVDKLVKKGLLKAEETPLGTLFTVINSDDLTCLDGSGDFFCPPFRETEVEHSQNDNKTELEPYKRTQEFKTIKNTDDHPEPENWMEIRIKRISKQFIALRNNGVFLSPKDQLAIERICQLPQKTEQLETWIVDIFHDYQMKNPNRNITSPLYCEKAIRTKLEAEKNPKKTKKESMAERVERMIQEGKIILQEESK